MGRSSPTPPPKCSLRLIYSVQHGEGAACIVATDFGTKTGLTIDRIVHVDSGKAKFAVFNQRLRMDMLNGHISQASANQR